MTDNPNTKIVREWQQEWLSSEQEHWGDKIEWQTALSIAERLDREQNDSLEFLKTENLRLTQEREEIDRIFELEWIAQQKAIVRWRHGTGNLYAIPDHSHLIEWLLNKLSSAIEIIKWAYPQTMMSIEDHRMRRVIANHKMTGTYKNGTTVVGLYQKEIDEIETCREFLEEMKPKPTEKNDE